MMPQLAFDGLHAAFDWTWRTSLETSVLIVLVLLTQCLWGRRLSAQGHYLLGLLILLRLATPTVPSSDFSALNLTRYWKTPSARTAPITSIADVPIARRTTALETRPMITDAPPSTAFAANSRRFVPWAWVWALGVATLLCAALIRHRRCARWIRHQISLTEPWVLSALATAQKEMGVRCAIRLVATQDRSAPALFGWIKPSLLVPEVALSELTPEELGLVFRHELVHLRRCDVLWNWVILAVSAVHWFNPLVWIAMRRLRADRELVCDSAVLRQLPVAEQRLYGNTLLKLLECVSRPRLSPSLVPVLNHKPEITRRIVMISKFRVPGRAAWALTTLTAIVLCCLTFTRAADHPKTVSATPAERSASNQDLEALRAKQRRERLDLGVQDLDARIAKQQKELDQLRIELGIPADVADGQEPTSGANESARLLEQRRISAVAEAMRYQKIHQQLLELPSSRRLQALPTAIPDQELSQLLHELHAAQAQHARLSSEFGPQQSDVRAASNTVATVTTQVENRVEGIMAGLQAQIAANQATAEELNLHLRDHTIRTSQLVERYRPYFRAKRSLAVLERVRDNLAQQELEAAYNPDR